jgi:REP element-mobilizing transposase RayT
MPAIKPFIPYAHPLQLSEVDSTSTGRRIILPGHWVFCSSRTIGGRFAFSELSEQDCARVMGLLIVAMKRYDVEVAAFLVFSNHIHTLARTWRNGRQISLFNQYIKAGMARLVHKKHGTSGTIWDGPFAATNLLDDEAELAQFDYICRHGVKEKLVFDPAAWHLCNTIDAVRGHGWINGLFPDRDEPKTLRPVRARLSPLTAWTGDRTGWRRACNTLVDGIVADAAGMKVAEMLPITKDHWHWPAATKKSGYKRTFKALSAERDTLMKDAYEARSTAIASAVDAIHALVTTGRAGVGLPECCQWPPFVAHALQEPFVAMRWAEMYALPPMRRT